MPQARYFLADAVLTAIFTFSVREGRSLFAAFDQIAERPRDMADSMGQDWDGRLVCIAHYGRFQIGYLIAPDSGVVTITLVRPRAGRDRRG